MIRMETFNGQTFPVQYAGESFGDCLRKGRAYHTLNMLRMRVTGMVRRAAGMPCSDAVRSKHWYRPMDADSGIVQPDQVPDLIQDVMGDYVRWAMGDTESANPTRNQTAVDANGKPKRKREPKRNENGLLYGPSVRYMLHHARVRRNRGTEYWETRAERDAFGDLTGREIKVIVRHLSDVYDRTDLPTDRTPIKYAGGRPIAEHAPDFDRIDADQVDNALGYLTGTDRTIAYLWARGFSADQIADEVGMNIPAVWKRVQRIKDAAGVED